MKSLRWLLTRLFAAAVLGSVVASGASAQSWPSKPLRLVVPYPPGTGPDLVARLLAEGLGKDLKAHVIVDNKPGANAIIGTDAVVKAPADGHTFLLVDRLTLSVNPLLYKPLPFDPKVDLVSIGNVADVNLYLVASSALPDKDYASFVAYAKANPDTVAFGTGGVGSIMHLNMELVQGGSGSRFLHVPFKALAEVIPAMLGGHVAATSGGVEAILPHVQAGRMKLLAIGAPERAALTPDVPTIREVAGADLLLSTSYSMHARAGTPPEILARVTAAVGRVVSSKEMTAFAEPRGLQVSPSSAEALDARIAEDGRRVGKLVAERDIRVK